MTSRSTDKSSSIPGILRLIRPEQWTKNAFVMAGFIFARQWDDIELLSSALLAFVAFCAAASATYIQNDWLDIESDRAHATKRHRPLASGQVGPRLALVTGLLLAATAIVCARLAGPGVLACIAAYLILNALYSRWLKHVVIVDVFTVASGFMLRLLAGTSGIGIPPSSWFILTGVFLTLFLGFAKRRAEWTETADGLVRGRRRAVMNDYSAQLLDVFLAVTASAAILSYGLYTVDPTIQALHGTTSLVYTVPLVAFGILRYLFLVHARGQGQDPTRDIFRDVQLLLCGLAWVGATMLLIG